MFSESEKGEGLIEVMVTIFIATVVIGAMAIATIRGVSNAQFSQSQVQATKFAQETLEQLKTIRDRNLSVSLLSAGTMPFSQFQQNASCPDGCYFSLNQSSLSLTQVAEPGFTALSGGLRRQINLTSSATNKEITATAIVSWTDAGGPHQSNLQTIFGQIR